MLVRFCVRGTLASVGVKLLAGPLVWHQILKPEYLKWTVTAGVSLGVLCKCAEAVSD